jgi:uncharacterized protein (TIGR03083 family)
MDEKSMRDAIAAQRTELAGILGELDTAGWDAPTLCQGWRVPDLVAHMTMPFRYSMPRFLAELARSHGDFHKMADRTSRRDARQMSGPALATSMRDNARHPWKPPRGGYQGALTHDMVHGLDFTIPLGIDRKIAEEPLRAVLDGLAKPFGQRYFEVDLDGVELVADDLDWRFGSGAALYGTAQDHLALLAGRKLPPNHLRGADAERFTS